MCPRHLYKCSFSVTQWHWKCVLDASPGCRGPRPGSGSAGHGVGRVAKGGSWDPRLLAQEWTLRGTGLRLSMLGFTVALPCLSPGPLAPTVLPGCGAGGRGAGAEGSAAGAGWLSASTDQPTAAEPSGRTARPEQAQEAGHVLKAASVRGLGVPQGWDVVCTASGSHTQRPRRPRGAAGGGARAPGSPPPHTQGGSPVEKRAGDNRECSGVSSFGVSTGDAHRGQSPRSRCVDSSNTLRSGTLLRAPRQGHRL